MVGLMSLLEKHRRIVLDDLENPIRNVALKITEYWNAVNLAAKLDSGGRDSQRKNWDCLQDRLVQDCRKCTEGAEVTETILVKGHLRRLRNVYTVLMEICRKDEKLLEL
jgi:hypothetical protein